MSISIMMLLAVGCVSGEGENYMLEGDVSIASLYSLAKERSQRIKSDIWIEGMVVLNDKVSEAHRTFVLYDGTAGVEVKVDLDSVDSVVPLYAEVRIRCQNLYVGREGSRLVLGVEPTSLYVVDRIPEAEIDNYMSVTPAGEKLKSRVVSISDVDLDAMLNYVRVDDVRIVADEVGCAWCDNDAEELDSSLRHFTDGCDTLTVATLNKCDYASVGVTGDIVTLIGVVDSYQGEVVLRLSDFKAFSNSSR